MIIDTLKSLGLRIIDTDIGADFCHDEYAGGDFVPMAVVECASTEDVSAVMKACFEAGVAVTVRGAGTGQCGGSVAVAGGIVLSVKDMNKVLSYDETTNILTVEAGVLLQDVKAEATKYDMQYPVDPGELTATIGGNVATNAAGPCALKYGKTSDYVVDAKLVLADGTVASFASNEAVIGSEGTMAVVTEVSLKLISKVGADAILLLPFMEIEAAVTAAKAIVEGGFEPSIVELMDTDIIEFSGKVTGNPVFPVEMDGDRPECTLMVTLEAEDDDAVMEMMEAIAGLWEEGEIECLDILVGDTVTMKREFWTAHGAFHTAMESGAKSAREVNVDLPTENIPEMIEYAKVVAENYDVSILCHSHVISGGTHIHIASEKSKDEMAEMFPVLAKELYGKCVELGGNIVGEYGVGYAKKDFVSEEFKASFAELKVKYDKKGILNPGKMV